MENVIESDLVIALEESILDILPSLLQVCTLVHDTLHTLIRKLEDAHWCATDVVSVCDILDKEGLVVQNGTCCQSLDNEVLVADALVIGH